MAPEKAVLPKWAKLVKRKAIAKKIDITTKEKEFQEKEEVYLRTICYQILSKKMDGVFEQALATKLSSLLNRLSKFLYMHTEEEIMEESACPSRKRARKTMFASSDSSMHDDEKNDDLLRQACDLLVAPHARIDSRLLPIALIEGPFFELDRNEMMKSLFNRLKASRKRTAFVRLRKANRRRFSWMEELVQQCIRQEPYIFLSGKVRQNLEANASLTDILIFWAQHSLAFDDIIVFLEVEDVFYSSEFQDFLCYLAVRRSEYGLPLNVVMLCPHEGRRALDFRSWAQGSFGFSTRTFTLPSTSDIFHSFWKELLTEELPMLLPTSVYVAIRQSFHNQKSAVRALIKLKQAVAYSLLTTGSFLSVAWYEQIQQAEWPRLACFCLHPEARDLVLRGKTSIKGPSMLRVINEMQLYHVRAHFVMRILHDIEEEGNNDILSFSTLKDDSDVSMIASYAAGAGHRCLKSRKEILGLLLKSREYDEHGFRHKEEQDQGSNLIRQYIDPLGMNTNLMQKGKITDLVNEMIVLFGRCDDFQTIEKGLVSMLDKWNLHPAETKTSQRYRKQSDTTNSTDVDWSTVNELFCPEPRRNIVAGLLSTIPSTFDEKISLTNVAATMFHAIRDRVSIEQGEWFSEIQQNFENKISRKAAFSLFSCGLRYLKICGLISEKWRSNRNYVVYEKTKLVWCSGD